MGIKNLSAVFNKYCKDSICSKNISEYRNKKIAIDLSIYLHRYYATQGNSFFPQKLCLGRLAYG